MTEQKKPEPLTQEQLRQIEETNNLLAIFSKYIEDVQQANPGVELPTNLLYNSFLLGAAATQKRTQAVTMHTAKEINEMKMVMFTYMDAVKKEQGE